MNITHASIERITEVTESNAYSIVYKGCLFFAEEGNTYCLGEDAANYHYSIEVENVIETSSFFYKHDYAEEAVQEVFEMMRNDCFGWDEMTDEELSELLDETKTELDAEADWAVQQYQGILAHKLGYDAAESEDEQGTVWIAYCVNRDMKETKIQH